MMKASSPSNHTRNAKLVLEAITREEDLWPLEVDWNELLCSAASNTVFLTWEWITTWWRVYGKPGTLYVLVVREEGRLVGIAPLKRVPVRLFGQQSDRIEFIGYGSDVTPEYLDVIVRGGYEAAVAGTFADHLASESKPYVLDLRPLVSSSVTLRHLRARLASDGRIARRTADAVCPVLDLPPTTEEFLKSRSRNYKKKLGEYERRCHRELASRIRMSSSREEIRRDIATLGALHRKRWKDKSSSFVTREYLRFHRELAERMLDRGWIRLFVLETSTRAIGMLYCFAYAGRYYYYQSGWDPDYGRHRIGFILMHCAIIRAIAEKACLFDFLRGEEKYKYRWATRNVLNLRLTYWSTRRVRLADYALELRQRVAGAISR